MQDDMKLQAAYATIDDLRSLKVQLGREIARKDREIDDLKRTITHLKNELDRANQAQQDKVPVDAISRTRIGDPTEHRERCNVYLESVQALRKEDGAND